MDESVIIESAEVICVGTELLLGQTINTNAADLGRYLSELGINVFRMAVVGDNHARLQAELAAASERVDLIILTGGLGPTDDDITMEVAAAVTGNTLTYHPAVYEAMLDRFARMQRAMPENNRKQALLPENGIVLPNAVGTAPGAIMTMPTSHGNAYVILLPGPPHELRTMMETHVLPWLKKHSQHHFVHHYVRLIGIGESSAVERIADLINGQAQVTIAPYASVGEVALRVSERLADGAADTTGPVLAAIQARLHDHIYEIGERSLAEVVSDLLRDAGATLAVAESMSGGRLAAEFTAIPGASDVFKGGIIAYQNASKIRDLALSPDVLQQHGTVAEPVARAMAEGVRSRFASTYGLAITGLAGPGQGQETKPVGTSFIGLAGPQGTHVYEVQANGQRTTVMRRTVMNALMRLWEALK